MQVYMLSRQVTGFRAMAVHAYSIVCAATAKQRGQETETYNVVMPPRQQSAKGDWIKYLEGAKSCNKQNKTY